MRERREEAGRERSALADKHDPKRQASNIYLSTHFLKSCIRERLPVAVYDAELRLKTQQVAIMGLCYRDFITLLVCKLRTKNYS